MPPAITPSAQVRRAAAPVRRQRGCNFCNRHPEQAGFYDQFTGKFHAGRTQVHLLESRLLERANAAVKVGATRVEEELADPTEDGVAEIPMQQRHCVWR